MSGWTQGHDTIARLLERGHLERISGGAANGAYLVDQARQRLGGARAALVAHRVGAPSNSPTAVPDKPLQPPSFIKVYDPAWTAARSRSPKPPPPSLDNRCSSSTLSGGFATFWNTPALLMTSSSANETSMRRSPMPRPPSLLPQLGIWQPIEI